MRRGDTKVSVNIVHDHRRFSNLPELASSLSCIFDNRRWHPKLFVYGWYYETGLLGDARVE